jgi:mono/diheme cytochrome c family protein
MCRGAILAVVTDRTPKTALIASIAAALGAGLTILTCSGAVAAAFQPTPRSTWDGVYTLSQAATGEALYQDKCYRCHDREGVGKEHASSLVDSVFGSEWDGLTVRQLFDRTRRSMPMDEPGSLSREDTAALLAYLFQLNGFPPGTSPLPDSSDRLDQITYVASKP